MLRDGLAAGGAPWFRVLGSSGKISLPANAGGDTQRAKLAAEGVAFGASVDGVGGGTSGDPDSNEPCSVLDHDFVIWLGDLNYRINLDAEATRTLATRGEIEALRAHDQLLSAVRSGAAFDSFSEAELDFPPTYKYDIGTDNFDTSEKRRPPAWC